MANDIEYRLECLARDILTRPLYARQEFLKAFEKNNGTETTDKLKALITTEWEKQRNAKRTENITGEPGADLAGTEPHGQVAGAAYRS